MAKVISVGLVLATFSFTNSFVITGIVGLFISLLLIVAETNAKQEVINNLLEESEKELRK